MIQNYFLYELIMDTTANCQFILCPYLQKLFSDKEKLEALKLQCPYFQSLKTCPVLEAKKL